MEQILNTNLTLSCSQPDPRSPQGPGYLFQVRLRSKTTENLLFISLQIYRNSFFELASIQLWDTNTNDSKKIFRG